MQFSWARRPFVVAAAGLLLIVFCSAATVHINYRNQWTGLFCIGQRFPLPPPLRADSYVILDSNGFDGQFYRDIAHDPFNQRGFGKYIDDAHYRYRRILLPLLANVLALGQDRWVDGAYICIEWLSAFLGIYWIGQYALGEGRSVWWGLAYLVLPPTLISLDRMLTDLPFTTLCVGFFYFAYRKEFRGMFVTAMLACLARESGVFLVAGYTAYWLWKRDLRRALLFSGAVIPFAAWSIIESRFTAGKNFPFPCCSYPGSSILQALRTPYSYPLPAAIARSIQAFDVLSLLGIVACAILLWYAGRKGTAITAAAAWSCAGFVLLGVIASCMPGAFNHVYDYGRQYSPILVVLLFAAIEERRAMLLAPIAFMTLRVAVQVLPQASAILRSI
ncbi:MAG TPA: hypothetical protein VHZ07_19320 [Bryobacteraceae bacterium]|jgi:hypothetical protein|nr:hypothetical protein [Bryobacteraceae bacterium]